MKRNRQKCKSSGMTKVLLLGKMRQKSTVKPKNGVIIWDSYLKTE